MADEYITRYDAETAIAETYSPYGEDGSGDAISREDAMREIRHVPAADVRPVVHAKITADGACSACGCYMPTDTRRDAIFGDEVHFCYYCGADMREVDDG